jgi:uncharacterized protein YbbC (DUF1343 family)
MTAGNGRFWNRMKILFMMIILIMSAAMLTACGGAGTQTEKNGSAESGSESSGSEKTGSESSGLEKKRSEKTKSEKSGAEKAGTAGSETAKPAKEKAEAEKSVKNGDGNEEDSDIILGDERADIYLPLLDGKRVALFTNQTGIVGNRIMTGTDAEADLALEDENVDTGSTDAGSIHVVEDAGTASLKDKEDAGTDSFTGGEDLIPFGQTGDGSPVEYGEHIVDALVRQKVDLTVIFVPEHGLRGKDDAGAQVQDSVDEKTGLPAISLYGSGAAYPSSADMDRFDTLVIDIQDVGLRYYTYYITMYYLMDACAAAGKEVIILDRPNPNGFYVDGPVLQEEFVSGVGILPIPVVHGMTLGELAQMINGEGWLSCGKDSCLLTVVPCENYTHQKKSSLVINPSPNLKDMRAVYLYASTCYFENTAFSVGRGTAFPFEIYGSPYITGNDEYDFFFTPESMEGAASPAFQGQECCGKNLRGFPLTQIWDEKINLEYVIDAYGVLQEHNPGISFFGQPDGSGHYWIDILFGTDRVRRMIEEGAGPREIEQSWQTEVEAFKEQRRPYLLYEE